MPSQLLPIPFPFAGLTKNRGYQSGEPQSTRGSLNVTPDDSGEARTRGGSRPGVTKRYSNSLLGSPLYLVRVSSGDDDRVPEFLVVGTAENVFVGKSIASGTTIPITYSENLSPLTGELCTEDGDVLMTEDGNPGGSQNIIIADFDLQDIDRSVVTQYQGTVILGAVDSTLVSGTGTIAGSASTSTLDDAGVADWTTLGIDPAIHWVEITSTDSDLLVAGGNRTFKIASISAGEITLDGNAFGDGVTQAAVATDYVIRIGVRQLDPETPNIALLPPTLGYVPTGASAVTVYRDRLVWGVGRTWFMSRQGDPGDYDYGADPEDPSRAIAGNASEAGQPADPIIALASAGFDYLIIFAESSTWVMRGDPGYGGQLYNSSRSVGCIGSKAWCYGEATEIYFLGKDGLYLMPSGASGIQSLSPTKLPRELRGIDRDNSDITLAYDPDDNGVLIFVVPKTGQAGDHFWYDIETQSFWPIRFSVNGHQPIEAVTFGGSPTRDRRVVMACFDGFVREWTGTTDDGTAISSNVILGPFPMAPGTDMGNSDIDGLLAELVTTTGADSSSITVEAYFGRTPEEATQAAIDATSPDWSATIAPGRSWSMRPRRRGNAFCLRLVGSGAWAFESAFAKLSVAGKTRR